METKISVVIPAFNAEKYIKKCLSSIKNQSFADFEAIVVIDGATDKTKEIAESFAKKDNRFIIIEQENKGPSGAKNKGIDFAKGKYITFVDSDDYVDPDYLQTLFDTVKDVSIAICGFYTETSDGTVKLKQAFNSEKLTAEQILNRLILSENAFGGYDCNKLYLLDLINKEKIRFLSGQKYMFEDLLFNFRYLKCIDEGRCCDVCTYHYVHHESEGMSRGIGDINSKWLHYTDALDIILAEEDNRYGEFMYKVRMAKVWHCATAVRVLAHFHEKHSDKYKEMRRYIGKNLIKYLCCKYLPVKKRLGGVLTYFCPKLSFVLWNKGR